MIQLSGFLGRRRRWVVWPPGSRSSSSPLPLAVTPDRAPDRRRLRRPRQPVEGGQRRAAERLRRAAPTASPSCSRPSRARARPSARRRSRGCARAVAGSTTSRCRRRRPPRRGRSCSGPAPRCPAAQRPQSSDELIDSAATLRDDLDPGSAASGVTTYLAGQPTIWAGMQELSKEDLAKAESGGFPIVALILLVVFGSLAAAALPLALGFVSVIVTGALIYFISLQMATSVFVTNMASMIGIGVAIDYSLFILARYREERRAGPRARRRPRPGALDLGPRRHLLRPRRDHLPGRPLDGRQPGAALDGARGDDRRRRLDPHRDDPAAGADRHARRPRHARRRRRQGHRLLPAQASSAAAPSRPTRPRAGAGASGSAGRARSWPGPGRR